MSGRHYPFQSLSLFDWSSLYPHQLKVLQEVFEPRPLVMQPMSHYTKRKAWESKYDPKFQQKGGEIKVSHVPGTDSLPAKRWVLPVLSGDTYEEQSQHRLEMLAWLREQKFKYQVCIVTVDRRPREVFLFKKEKTALMFKLAWG